MLPALEMLDPLSVGGADAQSRGDGPGRTSTDAAGRELLASDIAVIKVDES